MRHAPFPITPEAALRWAELMAAAIRELGFPSDVEALLLATSRGSTPTMINPPTRGDRGCPRRPDEPRSRAP
jgi:hemoglobin